MVPRRLNSGIAIVLLILGPTGLTGCGANGGSIGSVTWLDGDTVYAIRDVWDANDLLVRFPVGSDDQEVVSIELPECEFPEFDALTRLSKGRLAIAARCEEKGTGIFDLDVASGKAIQIAAVDSIIEDVSWQGRLGYVAGLDSRGLCKGIGLFVDGRLSGFKKPISNNGATWYADSGLKSRPCVRGLEATAPAISPDGNVVYFAASGSAKANIGTQPPKDSEWSVLRMNAPEGDPTKLADGFSKVADIAISPDGRSLVVAGERRGRWSCWHLDSTTGAMRDLKSDSRSVSYSPDGHSIVVDSGEEAAYISLN